MFAPLPYDIEAVSVSALASLVLGLMIVGVASLLLRRADPKVSPRRLIQDEDGHPSLTNFQFLSWTLVFVFSLLWVYLTRIQGNELGFPPVLPTNTLVLMGINTASTIASRAIKYKGAHLPAPNESLWKMLYEKQTPSLARVQLFVWTLVSIIIYFVVLFSLIYGPFLLGFPQQPLQNLSIPDVDPSLVTLMGLSHGAYLGRKYFGRDHTAAD